MATTQIDLSDALSITGTSMSEAYAYVVPANQVLLLQEISVQPNSQFQSTGKLFVKVGNEPVTSQGGNTNEVPVTNSFSARFPEVSIQNAPIVKVLNAGERISVLARMTSGTGQIQLSVIGMLVDPDVWRRIVEKKLKELEN